MITTMSGNVQETDSKANTSVQDAIRVWVLNANIAYSSSSGVRAQSTPAIKLLYQPITQEEADRILESVTCDAQEITLPVQALSEVVRHLDESNALLPPSERIFKGWKVGLLAR